MIILTDVGLTAATLVSVLLKMSSQSVYANLDLLVTTVKVSQLIIGVKMESST